MATTGDIIRSAMRKIGVLDAGEPLPANEGADALVTLTQMVDYWSTQHLLIPVVNKITIDLFNNISEYTIGIYPEPVPVPLPDNHTETARPKQILAAFIRDSSGTDYIQEMINVEQFSTVSRKSNASRPTRFYVREGWPLNTILFESLPYADETMHLEVLQPLKEILLTSLLTDVINLPEGYERVLIYNLCLELAPEYGRQINSLIATQAVDGLKWLKRNNSKSITLIVDRALRARNRGSGTYINYIEGGP